jgi:hypothetical protein
VTNNTPKSVTGRRPARPPRTSTVYLLGSFYFRNSGLRPVTDLGVLFVTYWYIICQYMVQYIIIIDIIDIIDIIIIDIIVIIINIIIML